LVLVLGIAWLAGGFKPAAPTSNSLRVTIDNFAYSPQSLTVAANQPVNLTLVNDTSLAHDFSVSNIAVTGVTETGGDAHDMAAGPMPALHIAAAAGQTAVLTFTPTQPGIYQFFCTVPGHKDAGMMGTLLVK
jgi:uncharacterized cupredoxin-like copper-binding protein